MPVFEQFRLPDAGEGLTEAEIVAWHVGVGDSVVVNQTIVEIETAKSIVELPSPFDGVVTQLLVKAGVTVEVGTPIIVIDTDPTGVTVAIPPDVSEVPDVPEPQGRPCDVPVLDASLPRPARRVGADQEPPLPLGPRVPAGPGPAHPVEGVRRHRPHGSGGSDPRGRYWSSGCVCGC